MTDNQEPQENDDFDSIVNPPQEQDGQRRIQFSTLWEAIQQAYPMLYDGFLVRGVVILDYVDKDGDRALRWIPSPETPPWEVLGLTQQCVNDQQAENTFMISRALHRALEESEGDDDEQ